MKIRNFFIVYFLLTTLTACPTFDPKDNFPVNYIRVKNEKNNESIIVKSSPDVFSSFNSSLETPVIATSKSGKYVVAWTDTQKGTRDIFACLYDANGFPLLEPFQVNTYSSDEQSLPSVAINDSGSFVITWSSKKQDGDGYGVYARRYSSSGTAYGNEFKVNNSTRGDQWISSVGMKSDGGFVITWQSFGQDGSAFGIAGQRFDSSGNPSSPEFVINTTTIGSQEFCDVSMNSSGAFIVVWRSNQNGVTNGLKNTDIYGRKYNSSGLPDGSEFIVSTTIGEQSFPTVLLNDQGDYIASWNIKEIESTNYDIYAKISKGNKPSFRVSKNNRADQLSKPSIAWFDNGNFKISWFSDISNKFFSGMFIKTFNSQGEEQGSEEKLGNVGNTILQTDIAVDRSGSLISVWREY
jgi:hypothetical protein